MRFFGRNKEPAEMGPLFETVKDAMKDVQAYAKSHGGWIELVSVDLEGNVRIKFKGTCAYCPMADITLKLGIEKELRRRVPDVKKISQA